MLTYNDTIRFAGEWHSDGPIDARTVENILVLIVQALQLIHDTILVLRDILYMLDSIGENIAVTFWRGWDVTVMKVRLWLWPAECLVRITI